MTDPTVSPGILLAPTQYELACRAAGIGVWELHIADDRLVYCQIARSIFGFPSEGPVTREMVYNAIHPMDAAVVRSAAQRALDPNVRGSDSYSYRIKRFGTGETRWLIGNGIAYFNGDGPSALPLLYAGSVRDVTELEMNRQALIRSEERLRLAVDAAQMAVWDLDLATGVVAQSPDLNRMLGFPPEAHPTLEELRSRYAPGERERLEAEGAEATSRGETSMQSRVNYNVPGKGEVVYDLRAAIAAPPDGAENSTRVIGVLFDATDQVRAEDRLKTINGELRHRLKNMTALASIFARHTLVGHPQLDTYLGRIRALAMSADLMFGTRDSVLYLRDVVNRSLVPFMDDFQERIVLDGPDAVLSDAQFTGIALVLHELATNATKHGALSVPQGRIALSWRVQGLHLDMQWSEHGGPEVNEPPNHGFGLNLLRRGALPPPSEVSLEFKSEGLVAAITLSLA